jgi:hypothetical protein
LVVAIWKWYSNPDHFWTEFSREKLYKRRGKQVVCQEHLPWKDIVKKAREIREKEDILWVEKAKEDHLVNNNEDFTYREGSQIKILTTPSKVASRYRILKGAQLPWDTELDSDEER